MLALAQQVLAEWPSICMVSWRQHMGSGQRASLRFMHVLCEHPCGHARTAHPHRPRLWPRWSRRCWTREWIHQALGWCASSRHRQVSAEHHMTAAELVQSIEMENRGSCCPVARVSCFKSVILFVCLLKGLGFRLKGENIVPSVHDSLRA